MSDNHIECAIEDISSQIIVELRARENEIKFPESNHNRSSDIIDFYTRRVKILRDIRVTLEEIQTGLKP